LDRFLLTDSKRTDAIPSRRTDGRSSGKQIINRSSIAAADSRRTHGYINARTDRAHFCSTAMPQFRQSGIRAAAALAGVTVLMTVEVDG